MAILHKSYDLKQDFQNPCEEYKAKRFKCIKLALVMTGWITFILLLILSNVNFKALIYTTIWSNDNSSVELTTVTPTSNETQITIDSRQNAQFIASEHSACRLNVANTNFENAVNMLQHHIIEECKAKMELYLHNVIFVENIWTKLLLTDNLHLSTLTICNTEFKAIENAVLDTNTTRHLKSLTLQQISFPQLTAAQFLAARSLQHLQILNCASTKAYSHNMGFLRPLMLTIEKVNITLKEANNSASNPEFWFSTNATYNLLTIVNLSGNNFSNTLCAKSFDMLTAVQQLILNNCSIKLLAADTFTTIQNTLKFLDLSNNQLTTIAALQTASFLKFLIAVNLTANLLHCNCSNLNTNFLAYCHTPAALQQLTFTEAALKCQTANATDLASFSRLGRSSNTDVINTNSNDYIILHCDFPLTITNAVQTAVVKYPDTKFYLYQTYRGAVNITIPGTLQKLGLFYFGQFPKVSKIDEEEYKKQLSGKSFFAVDVHENLDNAITCLEVNNLSLNQNYIFCIMRIGENTMSPFNCQAFHEGREYTSTAAFLRRKDKLWFILLSIVLLLIFLLLPIIAAYIYYRKMQQQQYARICREYTYAGLPRDVNHIYASAEPSLDMQGYMASYYSNNSQVRISAEKLVPKESAPNAPALQNAYHNFKNNTSNMLYNSMYEDYYEELA